MAALIYIGVIGDARIAPYQAEATGTVTGYDPPNHNQCRYQFTVAGRHYSGESGFSGTENPPIGTAIMVYYDTRDANISGLESYATLANGNRNVALLLFVLGFIVILIVSTAKLRKHLQSRNR